MTNDFVPFCPTDTGTNLEEQAAYLVDPQRTIGNQPGIASSQLVNKALRQGTAVAAALGQYVSNQANVNTLDNGVEAQLVGQMTAAFTPFAPVLTVLLSGAGTWYPTYMFFVASANATAGATYTNNSKTFTVVNTISAGAILQTTGTGAPSTGSGTLTLATGTGDSTITFYAARMASWLEAEMVGGGGGGGGSGTSSGGASGNGGDTTFGSSFLTAGGGPGGGFNVMPPLGGINTINAGGQTIKNFAGGNGGAGNQQTNTSGGNGGSSAFGGSGMGGYGDLIAANSAGSSASANTGSGGGGGGGPIGGSSAGDGQGGASGGYILSFITAISSSYVYAIGSGGAGGSAGASGAAGGNGAAGILILKESFQ